MRARLHFNTKRTHFGASGFTLIETLIVAIMLAILAAIVVPSFEGTTYESKLSSLDTNLASMRKAIDMYYYQHSHYPGAVKSGGTCIAGINTDTATPGAAAFVGHITQYSNQEGVSCSLPAGSNYGPYLQ